MKIFVKHCWLKEKIDILDFVKNRDITKKNILVAFLRAKILNEIAVNSAGADKW